MWLQNWTKATHMSPRPRESAAQSQAADEEGDELGRGERGPGPASSEAFDPHHFGKSPLTREVAFAPLPWGPYLLAQSTCGDLSWDINLQGSLMLLNPTSSLADLCTSSPHRPRAPAVTLVGAGCRVSPP